MNDHLVLAPALAAGVATLAFHSAPAALSITPEMTLAVDISDTTHKLIAVRESLQVSPGPLKLRYPQWIPGNHGPTGQVTALSGLIFRSDGKTLNWRRDPHDPYAFDIRIPSSAKRLEVQFDILGALDSHAGNTFSSPQMVRIDWQSVVLYPAGRPINRVMVVPSIAFPTQWTAATALTAASATANSVSYSPVDLETLIDSPAYAGQFLSRYRLASGARTPISVDVFADTEAASRIPAGGLDGYTLALDQTDMLFASKPYDHYDFLVTLSNKLSRQGVEHRESSEDSLPIDYFADSEAAYTQRNLLVHEYVHVWNGKLRRPAGLVTADYNTPMQDDLLWVYEGLTTYLDKVLTVRGGLWTADIARDLFAETFAASDHEPGRGWRSLQDTTVEPIIGEAPAWRDWARGLDYYEEASLLWLDVDTQIRALSRGKRSLDDFIQAFFGGGGADRHVRAYTFQSVVAGLSDIQPYDWATLLRSHLDATGAPTPKDGLARGGYRLIYTNYPSDWVQRLQTRRKSVMLDYSLGATIGQDAVVRSVVWDGPAFRAGLSPGDKILTMDGNLYSSQGLIDALATSRDTEQPIVLNVDGDDGARTLKLKYGGGLRYAHLEHIPGAPRVLDDVLRAR